MKLVSVLALLLSNGILSQDIYYQEHFRLKLNDQFVSLPSGNVEYNVFGGVFSSSGDYLSGFLINNGLQKYLSSIASPGITDFYTIDSLTLLLYSKVANVNIYEKVFNDFIKVTFSQSEKYILISSVVDSSIVVSLGKKKIVFSIAETILDAQWIRDCLYILTIDQTELVFRQYDTLVEEARDIWRMPKEQLTGALPSGQMIIDSTRLFLTLRTAFCDELNIIDNQETKKICEFDLLFELAGSNCDGVFIVGQHKSDTGGALYHLTFSNETIKKLFDFSALAKFSTVGVSNITSVIEKNGEIYFILNSPLREDENLIKFSLQSKSFVALTERGFISGPIGFIN